MARPSSKRKRDNNFEATQQHHEQRLLPLLFSQLVSEVYIPCSKTTKRLELVRIVRNFFIKILTLSDDIQDNTLLSVIQLLAVSKGRTRSKHFSNGSHSNTNANNMPAKVTESKKNTESAQNFAEIVNHKTTEFGIGPAILYDIVADAAGVTVDMIKQEMKTTGDLATVVGALLYNDSVSFLGKMKTVVKGALSSNHANSETEHQPLTVADICTAFQQIVTISGTSSVEKRKTIVLDLLKRCADADQVKFLIRLIQNNLRINLQESTVLMALAHACKLKTVSNSQKLSAKELKEAVDTLKSVYSQTPSFHMIIPELLKHGIDHLNSQCFLTVGIPVRPMLGKPLKSVDDLIKKLSTQALKNSLEDEAHLSDDDTVTKSLKTSRKKAAKTSKKKTSKKVRVKFVLEYKYDGKRAQVHIQRQSDGSLSITIYSRSLKTMTLEFPDAVELLRNTIEPAVQNCILDCEFVCIDNTDEGRVMSFQQLTNRSQNSELESLSSSSSRLCIYVFDILYLQLQNPVRSDSSATTDSPLDSSVPTGSFMNTEYHVRRNIIPYAFKKTSTYSSDMLASYKGNRVRQATSCVIEYIHGIHGIHSSSATNDIKDDTLSTVKSDIENFLKQSLMASCEGVMIKPWALRYKPNDRSWYKLKKDYITGLADSLDLVPVGGYYGRGKRTGRFGSFLLACRNETTNKLEPLCKTGTGFTEDNLERLSKSLTIKRGAGTSGSTTTTSSSKSTTSANAQHTSTSKCSYHASDSECDHDCPSYASKLSVDLNDATLAKCDVIFEPDQVWEIICADLTLSSLYAAARGCLLHDPMATTSSKITKTKGVSTRFPRFIRVRTDKSVCDATSSLQVAKLYNQQFKQSMTQPIGGAALAYDDDVVNDTLDPDLDGSASD